MLEVKGLKIVIAGGGTGGHLFPGIALADAFTDISLSNKILFMNTGNEIEEKVLKNYPYKSIKIPSAGLMGKSVFNKIKGIFKILFSVFLASKELDKFNTDAVIGVGGYVSAPVIIAALFKGIPVFIQEQNTIPGLANRVFSKFSKLNFTSFEDTNLGSPKKKRCLGNPIRKKLINNNYSIKNKNRLSILVTGGSQGARAINNAVMEAFDFLDEPKKINIVHQTGVNDFNQIKEFYDSKNIDVNAAPFFIDFHEIISKSDLIISRAGASTISEISCASVPAILIPFPHAAHDHQYYNSLSLQNVGAAIVIKEEDLSGKKLAETINNIVKKPDILSEMSSKMKSVSKPNAAYDICSHIIGKLN